MALSCRRDRCVFTQNRWLGQNHDEELVKQALQMARAHWAIENRSHWRRDVTLQEDACQVRKGIAPRTLTLLNSFLLALFDWLGVTNVASQMRTVAARPILALRLFLLSLERIK